jgi:hypothetical protein
MRTESDLIENALIALKSARAEGISVVTEWEESQDAAEWQGESGAGCGCGCIRRAFE